MNLANTERQADGKNLNGKSVYRRKTFIVEKKRGGVEMCQESTDGELVCTGHALVFLFLMPDSATVLHSL